MSDPFTSPADQWGLIFYHNGLYRRAHTRQEWAQIADAITMTNLRHRDSVRGDDAWCATAVAFFTQLRDADAYTGLRADGSPVWHADERLIRAWLGAPSIPADARRPTVLHDHGWNDTLDPIRPIDPADLTMLVDLAQDAGVVGDPLHKVSLLRWKQDGTERDDALLVLVWRPDGPALPSGRVRLDELIAASQSATDRAVAVLSGVANVANRLLAAVAPEPAPVPVLGAPIGRPQPDAVHEQPPRHGGGAFRLNTGTAEPSPPPLPPPPAAPPPPRHPRT